MSMPKIPDINPTITVNREDVLNIIIASIAMEELSLAHILNAEGEKLQYVLGTLDGSTPGEITICDIMAVNHSIQKTLRDVIKTEMLLQFKLEDVVELSEGGNNCQTTIAGQKIWRDGNNVYATRPASVEISLLRDGVVIDTKTVSSTGNGKYSFTCLPVYKNSDEKYEYTIDEIDVPVGYKKTIDGFNVINTAQSTTTITGSKIWVDNDDATGARTEDVTVNLIQNGSTLFLSTKATSPDAPVNNVEFGFDNVPRFDDQGVPYAYTLTEEPVEGYTSNITGLTVTNTII